MDTIAARERAILTSVPPQQTPGAPGSSLECTLPPDTYFVLRDANGKQQYTRAQAFSLRDGELSDAAGHPLLGYRSAGGTLQPLGADAVDQALGLTSEAQLYGDGTVAYARWSIDPRSGERERQMIAIGRLALARFPAGTQMQSSDAGSSAPKGVAPYVGVPGDGSFPRLQPFTLQAHADELDRNLQRLQDAYLALDALRAAGTAQGDVAKTTMDLLK